MEGFVWYAITCTENGKYYAYAWHMPRCQNIASFVRDFPTIATMNACETKKYAFWIVEQWNKQFKENGTFMFDHVEW